MKVGVIGAGNVGNAVGRALACRGAEVTLQDVNAKKKVMGIGWCDSIEELVRTCETVIECIPTEPLPDGSGRYDLSILERVYRTVLTEAKTLDRPLLFVQMSTVIPGTAKMMNEKLAQEIAEAKTLSYGVCPSFLNMGDPYGYALNPRKIVIGVEDPIGKRMMTDLFRNWEATTGVEQGWKIAKFWFDWTGAELAKMAHNMWGSMAISFWNEWFLTTGGNAELVDVIAKSVDASELSRAYRVAGQAFGGACFPKDMNAMRIWARENEKDMRLLNALIEVNEEMKSRYGVRQQLMPELFESRGLHVR